MSLTFVCGALRSGTTVFRLMLNSHPEIDNPSECDFLFDGIGGSSGEPDVNEYIARLQSSRIFLSHELEIRPECDTYEKLVRDLVQQISGEAKLCLNIHRNFEHVHRYFPEAKLLHIVRDPRDVARSAIPMGWAGNTYSGVDHWINTESSWNRFAAQDNPAAVLEITYEDLISNLGETLGAVCEFLGVSYDPAMLDYHQSSTYSAPDISLIEQWRRKQSQREVELVEFKACDLMVARGYRLENSPPKPPSFLEHFWLRLASKLYTSTFDFRRYGVCLAVLRKLAYRFDRLPGRSSVLSRINQVDKGHLK